MFTICGGATEFNQWDQGQRITEPSLVAGDKVVFRNFSGMTFPMKAYIYNGEVVVNVPNKLLTVPSMILVRIDGKGGYRGFFNVNAREKPEDHKCVVNTEWPPDVDAVTLTAAKNYTDSQRLCYTESETITILNDTAVASKSQVTVYEFPTLFVGETYTVTINGVAQEHICKARSAGELYIGNLSLFLSNQEDTGEDFLIVPMRGIVQVNNGRSEDITISCVQHKETVHTIDQKFIPAMDSLTMIGANGNPYKLTVDENGTLVVTEV